jgi:hypothetical protein
VHDTTLQVFDCRALEVNEGEELVTVIMVTGLPTPFPGQNGQQIVLPTGVYRAPLSKAAAIELRDTLNEAIENVSDPKPVSDLFIPGSPADVDRVAENLRKFQ